MDILKAAVIANFAYTTMPRPNGNAKIQINGADVKYKYSFIEKNNTQAYILEDKENVIVTIRGSKEMEDFKDAVRSKKVHMETVGMVHEGFLEGFYDVFDEVDAMMRSTKKQVHFVGHSLGGAIAKLLGLYYRYEHVTVVTFGEPRSCKKKISSGNSEFIRVSNNMDVVPRLHIGYRHGVKEETHIYFPRKGDAIINPKSSREAYDVFTTFCLRVCGLLAAYEMIDDHLMDAYITLLS